MEEFNVSSLTGFIPEIPPLERLPVQFNPWEILIDKLSDLISQKRLRSEVDTFLPLLIVSDQSLPTERHWMRAYCVLTFLSQGYLWQDGEDGVPSKLPRQLAVPWWDVSQKLGLPPVATYAGVALWNWRLKDTNAPITLSNIEMTNTYTGTRDEEWFYLISVAVELAAVAGIFETTRCLEEVKGRNVAEVIRCLEKISTCIFHMKDSLNKMYEECGPDVFFGKIRQFQAGSKNLKAFENGLIFEGVSEEPKGFIGASAGQSSTLPVFDILLGVEHLGKAKEFLDLQRWHMPRPHRQFLLTLSLQPSLRTFVLENLSNNDLKLSYNRCVTALGEFRNQHIVLVTRYIVLPAAGTKHNKETEGGLATRGTGGSDFMVFLKSVRDETLKCIIHD